ncbi:hypothetical protein N658DRAFT_547806 [Parathielavia hyrcaniae]|uniref:Major facilitator superfamily (MFS) profile domain-containing protein n=1 Tax=Parathielavia hyrcaniae TaxID=113614 RepID=A0AAN6T4A5_9PEZI|nr:hypothetical protein N658DRAFT_547806 [Parathielavia hyrcaniae]
MGQLIAFRAVQGLGGSGLYSLSMIIMPEVTPDRAKKHIAAAVGLVMVVAGVGGPVLGGVLTQYTSWRWVFWINGPIGGVSLLVFLLAWPNKKHLPSLERRAWKDVDFVGAFLLIASAVLIVFPFQNATQATSWTSALFLAPLFAGLLSLALLFLWQPFLAARRARHKQGTGTGTGTGSSSNGGEAPRDIGFALPPVLLGNRAYVATALQTMLTGFPYLLCVYAFPVRFQVVYGRTALQAGLMLLPMLGAAAAGTVLAGAVNTTTTTFFETLMASCALMLLGCGLETTAGSGAEVEAKVLGFLVFVGLGFGLGAAAGTMSAGAEAPVWEHASAQGIVAQVRILGGSLGIAASSAILGARTQSDMPPEALAHLASDPSALDPGQWAAIRTTYTEALREMMIVCCAVLALAMVCTLGLYRRDRVSMEEMYQQRYREEAERRRAAVDVEAPQKLMGMGSSHSV